MPEDSIIGVIFRDGVVHQVLSNNVRLTGARVVLVENDEASRLLHVGFDSDVAAQLHAAANITACAGMGLACELTAEALSEFSRQHHDDPIDALKQIEHIMSALHDSLLKSLDVSGTNRARRVAE